MNVDMFWEDVEKRVKRVIDGVEETLKVMLENKKLTVEEAQEILDSLAPSFSLLARKGVLQILYTLLLLGPCTFTELLESSKVNRRTLSFRLKQLQREAMVTKYIETVNREKQGKTLYVLTEKGRSAALLAIPLIYYISKTHESPSIHSTL
ncbi:MAG: winged helix-turn-helix transcriptional regulator [Thermofilum sp.]|uniref:winged helix-turn-helix transcriptional regulator n=1 Tax=Thermofilum sp. TaxID=1961369 RepID=UPI0025888E8C|nr:winged helix-turn-helix transcriptional regulator [Thermofilum sp.]MCI4409032.1 winged helix-turn-helix transcriptional regulator [Thermofilum sp.]